MTATPRNKRVPFRKLPAPLMPPNIEVLVFAIYCPGFVEVSMAIWGAYLGGIYFSNSEAWYLVLASALLLVVFAFYGRQGLLLFRFWRLYAKRAWIPTQPPSSPAEVNDPALRLLTPVLGPKARDAGNFDPPPSSVGEPARTEHVLRMALTCGCRGRLSKQQVAEDPSLHQFRLYTWLVDSHGSSFKAVCFMFMLSLMQLLIALVVAIFEHDLIPGRTSRLSAQLAILIVLLFLTVVWTARVMANDRLLGWATMISYLLEMVAMCFLTAVHLGDESGAEASAQAANGCLLAAVIMPLALQVYDFIIAPVFRFVHSSEGTWCEVAVGLLAAAVFLPIEIVMNILGICDDPDAMMEIAAGFDGAMQDTVLEPHHIDAEIVHEAAETMQMST